MNRKTMCGLSLLVMCAVAMVLPALAQNTAEKPAVYTYVAEWSVPRAQWGEMEKNADLERPVMDKLVAEGTILGYGVYSILNHTEGEPTHGSWFSATSEGNLVKALEVIYATPGLVTSPAQSASKHWDLILTSNLYNGRPGKSAGYLSISRWQLKPGGLHAYNELMKKSLVPILDKLVADGTITSYGTDREDYHSSPIGTIYEYFTVPDAASLDKANKAIEDAFDADPALSDAFRALFETQGHRDYLTRLRFMVNK